MEQLKIPMGYHADLNLHDTQVAIKTVKDFFQQTLAQKLNLLRVSAPIFVDKKAQRVCNCRARLAYGLRQCLLGHTASIDEQIGRAHV